METMDRKYKPMKNRRLWMSLAGIALLSVAFWFLNFRLAASNTQSQNNITTTGIGDGLPDVIQHRENINLALVGEGLLVTALQEALVTEVNNAGIGTVRLVEGNEPKYQNPVLIVRVESPDLFWTPFFATSQFTVQAGYSSSGDVTLVGKAPVTIDNRYGPALAMYGEYQVSDRSWGLLSRPGYHQILAHYLARQIVATLKDLYHV
jgi:hypothetical protein